jgi:hypothetical protein
MAVRKMNIPAGTALFIGAPARPMDNRISIAIGRLIDSIKGVAEAHLPQMFAVNVMEEPAQVLVLLLHRNANAEQVARELELGLPQILPEGAHLDVWPMPINHPMADDVRRTGCMI